VRGDLANKTQDDRIRNEALRKTVATTSVIIFLKYREFGQFYAVLLLL
jgi:hypothetical protein